MLRAWRYTEGAPGRTDVAADALTGPRPAGSFLWVDIEHPETGEIEHAAEALGVHHIAAEDLAHAGQRTKLEHYSDHRHVAVHDMALDEAGVLADGEIDIVFGDGWLLTVRHSRDGLDAAPIDSVVERFERQRVEHGSSDEGFAIWSILDDVVDRYFVLLDAVDDYLDGIEEAVFAPDSADHPPQAAFALRRTLVAFRRTASPMREVVSALLRREAPEIGDAAIPHLQDVYDHVLRALDLLESQRELLSGLLEAQLSVASMRMNRVMKATSSWGAILVVNTLITGVYGMNFRHMPELHWYLGYPLALAAMAVATVVLYVMFRRRDWL
ncbi:MAG: magnesium/cobalt transporter CorA [Acidimicrobiia bacterium]|nr:magnesium/cobalt transporter CorA [Acidimicrobiia bacterium]